MGTSTYFSLQEQEPPTETLSERVKAPRNMSPSSEATDDADEDEDEDEGVAEAFLTHSLFT